VRAANRRVVSKKTTVRTNFAPRGIVASPAAPGLSHLVFGQSEGDRNTDRTALDGPSVLEAGLHTEESREAERRIAEAEVAGAFVLDQAVFDLTAGRHAAS